jgi:hypothetical protein
MRLIWAIIGLLNNAAKGTAFLWDPIDPNGEDVSRHRYGWQTAHMRIEWARFGLPNPDVLHLGSNIWVEWFEQPVNPKMHLRRGVKMMSALWLWSTICAFVLGALIF